MDRDHAPIKETVYVYGGSFDPPHFQHFQVAVAAKKFAKGHPVWMVPCSFGYAEKNPVDATHRIRMCKLMLQDMGRPSSIFVKHDAKRFPSVTCTYELLKKYQRLDSLYLSKEISRDYVLVIGSDTTHKLKGWKHAPELMIEAKFLIVERPGYKPILDSLNVVGVIPQVAEQDCSSTTLRSSTEELFKNTTTSVADYIKTNKLYGV